MPIAVLSVMERLLLRKMAAAFPEFHVLPSSVLPDSKCFTPATAIAICQPGIFSLAFIVMLEQSDPAVSNAIKRYADVIGTPVAYLSTENLDQSIHAMRGLVGKQIGSNN